MYQNDLSTNNDISKANQEIESVTIPVQHYINVTRFAKTRHNGAYYSLQYKAL